MPQLAFQDIAAWCPQQLHNIFPGGSSRKMNPSLYIDMQKKDALNKLRSEETSRTRQTAVELLKNATQPSLLQLPTRPHLQEGLRLFVPEAESFLEVRPRLEQFLEATSVAALSAKHREQKPKVAI